MISVLKKFSFLFYVIEEIGGDMMEFKFLKKVSKEDLFSVKGLLESTDYQAYVLLGDFIVENFIEHMDEAIYFYKLGVKKKDIEALHRLGAIYVTPEFGFLNVKLGLKLIEKSAKGGCAFSQVLLGAFYYNGNTFTADIKKAIYWYTRASNLGDAEAMHRLGLIYEFDYPFLSTSLPKAYDFYTEAVRLGHEGALSSLNELLSKYGDTFNN